MGFYTNTSFNRKVLSLVGAFFIHFVIGTTYTTGNLSIYIASYLRDHGSSITIQQLNILFPLQVVAATGSVIFGTYLTNKTNQWLYFLPRTCAIGNFLVVMSVFVTSYLKNAVAVMFIWGITYGLGTGLSVLFMQYATPLMVSWSHFPAHKGRISGIIISGFGFGTTVFNLVATKLINPDNRKASIKHDGEKYFSSDISDNVPSTLRYLAACYLGISVCAILLVGAMSKLDKSADLASSPNDECPSLKEGVKHRQFAVLFALGFLANTPGLYVATAYKTYGTLKINNDDFLAITGSIASLFNGSFRYVWPQLMDKSSFKLILMILLSIQLPLLITLYYISEIKALFLIWICGIYACEGGLATLFPSVIVKVFGKQ
jgi:hypothetical protein